MALEATRGAMTALMDWSENLRRRERSLESRRPPGESGRVLFVSERAPGPGATEKAARIAGRTLGAVGGGAGLSVLGAAELLNDCFELKATEPVEHTFKDGSKLTLNQFKTPSVVYTAFAGLVGMAATYFLGNAPEHWYLVQHVPHAAAWLAHLPAAGRPFVAGVASWIAFRSAQGALVYGGFGAYEGGRVGSQLGAKALRAFARPSRV
jgi:hypothetical protein